MAGALDGLTVLDLSGGPAAALATMLLADHGARVLRLIAPGAAHLREGGFLVWDRGKACVRLDLDAALEGFAALNPFPLAGRARTPAADYVRLIAGADVLVEDFAPAARLQRLVEWSWLRGLN